MQGNYGNDPVHLGLANQQDFQAHWKQIQTKCKGLENDHYDLEMEGEV